MGNIKDVERRDLINKISYIEKEIKTIVIAIEDLKEELEKFQ